MTDAQTYETMSDEDVIKAATAWVEDPNDDMSQALFNRLIALARIGAAVKPRPVYEVVLSGNEMPYPFQPPPELMDGLYRITITALPKPDTPSTHEGE
jgi:hypothetical protein